MYFCILTQCISSIFYGKVIKYTHTYIYTCIDTLICVYIYVCYVPLFTLQSICMYIHHMHMYMFM